MPFRTFAALLAAVSLVSAAPPQEKGDRPPAGPEAEANVVEARFADGSLMKLTLLHESIEVATRYGKLNVPVGDIRRIEFGLRVPEATARRIDAAIARLSSEDFKQREAATKELVTLRELAYPAVLKASRTPDLEAARRAKDVLKAMAEKVPAERLRLKPHDTIVTADFTIAGQIEVAAFKARTPYFGEAQLRLAELRTMRWLANEHEVRVAVDGAKYGLVQEAWLDTGVDVGAETDLAIVASGTIDLYPIAPEVGVYLASPDGWSGGGGGGGFVVRGGVARGGGAAMVGLPGALIGRVGERGKPFVVGSKFDGVMKEEGRLYLRIVHSPWNNAPSGSYDVRINSGR